MNISPISSTGFDPQAMFTKLDKNGDGGIDKSEFLAAGKGQNDARAEKMFAKIDTSGDGVIDQTENAAAAQKMAQKGGGKPPQKAGGGAPAKGASGSSSSTNSTSSSSKTYDVMDTNEDGVVSAQERMAYALKLIEEKQKAEAEGNRQGYNALGQASAGQDVESTFSMSV